MSSVAPVSDMTSDVTLVVRVASWLRMRDHATSDTGLTNVGEPWIGQARDVLALLRDPTDAMVEAGGDYVDQLGRVAVDGLWSAMIDAAVIERG